jgi:hypothetical protein
MSLNVNFQLYRGTKASLAALATTGKAGLLAFTTDSLELYVDSGAGSPGIGPGNAWQKISNNISVFTAASQAAQLALANVQLGDFCVRTDTDLTYVLTALPSSTFGSWTAFAMTALPSIQNLSGSLSQSQLPSSIGAGSSLTSFDCGTF